MLNKNTFSMCIFAGLTCLAVGLAYVSQSYAAVSKKEVLGYYTNTEYVSYNNKTYKLEGSINSVMRNSDNISIVVPFWFKLAPSGNGAVSGFTNSQDEQRAKDAVKKMKAENIKVLGLVYNMLYNDSKVNSKELAHKILSDQSARNNFINQMEAIMIKYDLDGINIDIENVYKSDRNNYTNLIKELKEKLGSKGYMITVSIPAKTFDDANNSFSYPFDYKGIGQYADRVAIMTYDEHGAWTGSGPGPIASIPWQEKVIKYASANIPKDKIMLGIPAYGFDWTIGKSSPVYSSNEMSMINAKEKGISVQWDDTAKVPYYKYKDSTGSREVWFENARSFEEKINLMYKYDLNGIAIWRLGMEDPEIWDVVSDRVKVSKVSSSNVSIGEPDKLVYTQDDSLQLEFNLEGQASEFTVVITDSIGKESTHKYAVDEETYTASISLENFEDGWYGVKVFESNADNDELNEISSYEFGINCFADTKNHWAREQITKLFKEGYVNGVSSNNFSPNGKITRAEFIAMIARVLDISEPTSGFITKFNDVGLSSHWAKNAIEGMEEKGYISGVMRNDGKYYINANQQITRAEMITILYNVFGKPELESDISSFNDIGGHWAETPIKALEEMNLVSGVKQGIFAPDLNCTRAEAAVVIQRYLERTAE